LLRSIREKGYAPSIHEIGARFKIASSKKRFYKKNDAVTLKAENDKYAPITVAQGEFRIVGRVVGLLRRF